MPAVYTKVAIDLLATYNAGLQVSLKLLKFLGRPVPWHTVSRWKFTMELACGIDGGNSAPCVVYEDGRVACNDIVRVDPGDCEGCASSLGQCSW